MKTKLAGLIAMPLLSSSLTAGCIKIDGMDKLLTYEERFIEDGEAKDIMRNKGIEYMRAGKLSDADVAFKSIKDFKNLERLALLYLENGEPEGSKDIYVFLKDNSYQVRPCHEVMAELEEMGCKIVNP
ncbi:hypothetical protein HYT92_02925 [Candidatus Pacearchaeota archaeon]|nr:hypothetical protein [Candidatus Pacearchaeota archaeon]